VRATDAAGNLSAYSNTASAATPDTTPPSQPGTLSANAVSAGEVDLSWGASTDNVGVTGYRIERCAGSGCSNFAQVATTTGTGTGYQDTSVNSATSYSYRVRATDAAGNLSAYSNTASAATPDTTPPSQPGTLSANAVSAGEVDLSWGASTDNVGVTGYLIERCSGSGCSNFTQIATTTGTGTSYKDTTVSASTSYSYRVRATDAAGNLSTYSNTASATTPTPDTQPPSQPGTLSANAVSAGEVDLSWGASTDNVGVTGYLVERCQGSGCTNFAQITSVAGSATSYKDTSVSANASYSYRVRATDAAGNLSPYSNTASATTSGADTQPPSQPGTLSANAVSGGEVDLSWGASTDNVGVTGYLIERCQGSGCTNFAQITSVAGSATSYKDTSVNSATSYSYRVRATDAAGNLSAYSNTASAATPDTTPPSQPGTLSANAVSGGEVDLSWGASTDNVGVTGYLIERCAGSGCSNFAQITSVAGTGTSYKDTSVNSATSYSYRVRATDAAGNLSAYSNTASAATPDTTPPSQPGTLSANPVSSGEVDLSWGASTDNVGVTGYRIERCTGSGCSNFTQIATTTGTGTSYKDTSVSASTSYSYRVRAADAAGNLSAYSNTAAATVPAPPSGLVAAYAFDEGSGTTVTDASGKGNTGTITNATWSTSGRFGGALSFNGTTSVVTIPDSSSLHLSSGLTLEAWVGPSTVDTNWRDVVYKGNDNFYLEATSTNSRPDGGLIAGGSYADAFGTSALPANTWSFLTETYDGSTLRLYVNGTQVASTAHTGAIATSSNPLQIGGDSLYGQHFAGLIDNVRIYNVALTAAQIQADQTTPILPAPPDTTPPSQPGTLSATTVSSGEVDLSWGASTDNVGVSSYSVERCQGVGCANFTQIGAAISASYKDTSAGANSSYSYRVRAMDSAGNLSTYSNTATATTPSSLSIQYAGTDANGVASYNYTSSDDGGGTHVLRVLAPTNPAPGVPHSFLYVLPVEPELGTTYGDGLQTLRSLDAQDQYNLTIIEPSFGIDPWYADNPSDPTLHYESFLTQDLVPWVTQNLTPAAGSQPLAPPGQQQNWLIGFSKSGIGGEDLLLKHPDIFTLAASWDFPADMANFAAFGPSSENQYGTDPNFQANYRLTGAFVSTHGAPFLAKDRIWIGGYQDFQTDVADYDALLTSQGILHTTETPQSMAHRWDSGWVPIALSALGQESAAFAATP
jgi:fibronectin type 3 domain-containing protein